MFRAMLMCCVLALVACEAGLGEPCGAGVGGALGTACQPGLYCEGDFDAAEQDADALCGPLQVFPERGVCVEAKAPGESCEGFSGECRGGECVHGRCVERLASGGGGWRGGPPGMEHVPASCEGAE